jgi:hypothetical protein
MGRTFMGLNKRLIKVGRVGKVRFREGWVLLNRDAVGRRWDEHGRGWDGVPVPVSRSLWRGAGTWNESRCPAYFMTFFR